MWIIHLYRYFNITIFFHNLNNFDAHLIIAKANELNIELNQNKRIDVIAQNSEKHHNLFIWRLSV